MADTPRAEHTALIQSIGGQARATNFYQLMLLLDQSSFDIDNIYFKPDESMSFPGSDITSITLLDDARVQMTLSFLGFYGASSPLPHYMLDALIQENESADSLKSFLEIFNQRIYQLLYKSWKKYRPVINASQSGSRYIQYLHAISGHSLMDEDKSELAYAGVLGSRVHNAVSLAGMVSGFLQGVSAEVSQFQPRWVRVSQLNYLTTNRSNLILGDTTLLGNEVVDLSQKISIVLGQISAELALTLLPGTVMGKRLIRLVKLYIGSSLQFDMILRVKFSQKTCLVLGQDQLFLGWTSWLGAATSDEYRLQFTID